MRLLPSSVLNRNRSKSAVLADKRMPLTVFETGAAERYNAMKNVALSRAIAQGQIDETSDRLVDVNDCGIVERNAVRGVIASGELPVRKMGRRTYTRLSHLLALIPDRGTVQAQEPAPANPNSLEAIAARVTGKRGAK
jgi:hypothetical protein